MAPSWQKEVDDFPEYYAEYFKKYSSAVAPLRRIICKGPITYVGHDLLQTDIANLKAAVDGLDHREVRAQPAAIESAVMPRHPGEQADHSAGTQQRQPDQRRRRSDGG